MADTPSQNFGPLPDTLTFGPFGPDGDIIVHIENLVLGCPPFVQNIGVPFVCEGEGYGSITIEDPDGALDIYMTTSTDHYSIRASDGSVTVDPTTIPQGTYCFYASDDAGLKTGTLTMIDSESGGIGSMAVRNLPLTTIQLNGSVNMPVIPDLSENDAITGAQFFGLTLATTLPDFPPDAEVSITISDCDNIAAVGVLPKIINLTISGTTSITDPAVVDTFINALNPPSADTCDIGSTLLALRTSASDTNYNACVTAGWTFI